MALFFEIGHDVVGDDGTVYGVAVDHRERRSSCWIAETVDGIVIGYAGNRAAAAALVMAHYDRRPIISLVG
jgi:hypothetical protein